MRARINNIPSDQESTWGAVLAVLRFDNRVGWHLHWTVERPVEGDPFTVIDLEVPGQDIDALRAEIGEAVDIVNGIVERDPLKAMVRADIGLSELYLQ